MLESPTNSGSQSPHFLYPRLPSPTAKDLVQKQAHLSVTELRLSSALSHVSSAPAATGGHPIDAQGLERLQNGLRELADRFGFPGGLDLARQQQFDRECGSFLFNTMGIVPADAADEGVWSFLTLVLAPEIAPWRFPNRTEERLLGKPRNALRRLWMRAWILGPDLTATPEGCKPLTEDEYVAIMERTRIGGSPHLARGLQETIWEVGRSHPTLPRPDITRHFAKHVRSYLPSICMDAMPAEQLARLLKEIAAFSVADLLGQTQTGPTSIEG